MKVISVCSLKGGAGKTSLAVFLSLALATENKRVLVVDVDPNNNLTDFFLRNTDADEIERRNVKHFITGENPPEECMYDVSFSGNVKIIPCTVSLHTATHELSRNPGTMLKFSSLLRRLPFDVVILDTPPFPGYELALALHASDAVLSPVALSRWTVQAYSALESELDIVSEGMEKIRSFHAVPVLVTPREEMILRKSLNGTPVTKSAVHRSASIRSAVEKGIALKHGTKCELEFQELAREVMS